MNADEWTFTPPDSDALRDDLVQLRRDCKTWKAIAVEAIHSLAAQYNRVTMLERMLAETRDELRRVTARGVEP